MQLIWSEMLGSRVDRKDANFFDLGGHSLLAIRLIYRLNELLGLQISARLVFEFPNLDDFITSILEWSDDRDRIEKIARFLVDLEDLPE